MKIIYKCECCGGDFDSNCENHEKKCFDIFEQDKRLNAIQSKISNVALGEIFKTPIAARINNQLVLLPPRIIKSTIAAISKASEIVFLIDGDADQNEKRLLKIINETLKS